PIYEMVFELDNPLGRIMHIKQHAIDGPYFESRTIILGRGEKESLVVSFLAIASSFTFRVAIDFEVDGHRYTQMVDDNGAPFRVTARPCLKTNDPYVVDLFGPGSVASAQTKLATYFPSAITVLLSDYVFHVVEPHEYLDQCRRAYVR